MHEISESLKSESLLVQKLDAPTSTITSTVYLPGVGDNMNRTLRGVHYVKIYESKTKGGNPLVAPLQYLHYTCMTNVWMKFGTYISSHFVENASTITFPDTHTHTDRHTS